MIEIQIILNTFDLLIILTNLIIKMIHYLIFDFIPTLKQNLILPFTIVKKLALVNDNSRFTLEYLMPQYISGASHLKDVSVSIFDINKLIHLHDKDKF